jgi:hypothetical protein
MKRRKTQSEIVAAKNKAAIARIKQGQENAAVLQKKVTRGETTAAEALKSLGLKSNGLKCMKDMGLIWSSSPSGSLTVGDLIRSMLKSAGRGDMNAWPMNVVQHARTAGYVEPVKASKRAKYNLKLTPAGKAFAKVIRWSSNESNLANTSPRMVGPESNELKANKPGGWKKPVGSFSSKDAKWE